jgi:hypothetical protein
MTAFFSKLAEHGLGHAWVLGVEALTKWFANAGRALKTGVQSGSRSLVSTHLGRCVNQSAIACSTNGRMSAR